MPLKDQTGNFLVKSLQIMSSASAAKQKNMVNRRTYLLWRIHIIDR